MKKNKKKNFDDICKAIALKHGVSVEDVKRDMQAAINDSFQNPTPQQKALQDSIDRKAEIPTSEELIYFIAKNIK